MTTLTHYQWNQLNSLALEIHSAGTKEELIELAIEELPQVVGAGWAGWNEHNARIRIDEVHMSKSHAGRMVDYFPLVNPLMDSHPIVEGLELIDDLKVNEGVFSLTDFKSMRQLRSVPMWWEVYRHVETKHQMVAQFHATKIFGVALTINGDQAFTEEQRGMIEVLSQHFTIAYRRYLEREALASREQQELNGLRAMLSRRENEVLPFLLDGKTNPEIAIILGISSRTVEKHVAAILEKACVENRRALMAQYWS